MDNKKIIIVLAVVVIILAIMSGFLALNSYKEVPIWDPMAASGMWTRVQALSRLEMHMR